MNRYISIFKRLFRGLRLATMILIVVLAYIALLKRNRNTKSLFIIAIIALSSGSAYFSGSSTASAKSTSKPVAHPSGPPKQIFERSKSISSSELMSFQGKPAYIVSAMGTNSGVLITDVSYGIAASCGIDTGDVLLSINQHVVTTPRDADRILADTPSGPIRVAYAHQGDTGLQLYNAQYNYVQKAGAGMVSHYSTIPAGSKKSSYEALQAEIPTNPKHTQHIWYQ